MKATQHKHTPKKFAQGVRNTRRAQKTQDTHSVRKKLALCVMSVILALAMVFGLIPNLKPSETFAASTPTISKSAQVLPDGAITAGSAASPIKVKLGEQIKYTIAVNMDTPPSPQPRYDVLFVLDWSASMNSGYNGPMPPGEKESGYPNSARVKAKNTIIKLSEWVFRDYPDSRIALMGLNSNYRNANNKGNTYLQVETDFVGVDGYENTIKQAFKTDPYLRLDDCVTFMQAAIDKLMANPVKYGGLPSYSSSGNQAPEKYIKPRYDHSRIPVVILISDFQFGMGDFGDPSVKQGTGGKWEDFDSKAKLFKSTYPEGIFLGARADTYLSTVTYKNFFGTGAHNQKMDGTFKTIGGLDSNYKYRWGWVPFTKGQTQEEQAKSLYELIQSKAPPPPPAVSIIDKLPAGLEYVSSSPAGIKSTVDGRDEVRWELPNFTRWAIVTVTAKVKEAGLFVNTGDVYINDVGGIVKHTTNPTYHKTDEVPPKITVSKTARVTTGNVRDPGSHEAPVKVKVGNTVEYIISVTNPGSSAVPDVTIYDILPEGMIYESCSPSGGTKTGNGAIWYDYTLKPGTTEFLIYAQVSESGDFVNYATIASEKLGGLQTNRTYHRAGEVEDPIFKLHLRQIILERSNNSVELPPWGYMRLTNDTTVNNVTTESGLHGLGETDFTEFIVAISKTDPICKVTDILPQYFEYAGYIATSSAVVHDPASRQSGEIALDSSAHSEYWVTVYLKPKLTVPGDYTWDFRTNHFGEIA